MTSYLASSTPSSTTAGTAVGSLFTPARRFQVVGYGLITIEITPLAPTVLLPVSISPEGGFIASVDDERILAIGEELQLPPNDTHHTCLLQGASLALGGSALLKVASEIMLATLSSDGEVRMSEKPEAYLQVTEGLPDGVQIWSHNSAAL
ncbi:hypothetical protein KSF_099000 [Reticulibacter mediterranei]|uniref:Uncharacterized protein n=1 Tax=Reticulibacter mediterranei TaxID=2778369 RepID=A0A8J3IZZ2_9CHLR|nr:hypothetical protein [Reticulibacter mediterranei]GHO99852.1 hypothetical protein KSF_099000 [Reticulibacter mediterranei]